jgi:hypothetical protein
MGHIVPSTGVVLCVRTPGMAGTMIRFGAGLIDQDNLVNHIAVIDHQDENGTWWGIEGRPGGVGWVDVAIYLESPYTISNQFQLMDVTGNHRFSISRTMQGLLGTPYDWRAIGEDAMRDLHIDVLWGEKWKGHVAPGHVVCSSVAAYAYKVCGLSFPGNVDLPHVQPSDWANFILENRYQ